LALDGEALSDLPPRKESRHAMYKRLGGLQGQSGQVWKISPTTGIWFPEHPVR